MESLWIIARYEGRIIRRNFIFILFIGISVALVAFYQFTYQSKFGIGPWKLIALPSAFPYVSSYLFNLLQGLFVFFLTAELFSRDRIIDTRQVFQVRPASTLTLLGGKCLGIIWSCLLLNVLILCFSACIHLFVSDSPFKLYPYFFYLFTLNFPTLVFITGITSFAVIVLRFRAIYFILLPVYVIGNFFYLGEFHFGSFDFLSRYIPNAFSDITGHPELLIYLEHRLLFLFLGIGCFFFSVYAAKRLPNTLHGRKQLLGAGILLLLSGIFLNIVYFRNYMDEIQTRERYRFIYNKYINPIHIHVKLHDITFRQNGEKLFLNSRVLAVNPVSDALEEMNFYLNPGLEVKAITGDNGEHFTFRRDMQAIIIHQALQAGDSIYLNFEIEGNIDERICYLEIPDNEYFNTTDSEGVLRPGKRNAFLTEKYTLLIPECLWYPTACPSVNPDNPWITEREFTLFSLKVLSPGNKTVISQGKRQYSGENVIFTNRSELCGMSLCMGQYSRIDLKMEKYDVELYYLPEHAFLFRTMSHITEEIAREALALWQRPGLSSVPALPDYPFKRLLAVETPFSFRSYIRKWKNGSDYFQPEMVLLPESGNAIDGKRSFIKQRLLPHQKEMSEVEIELERLEDIVRSFNSWPLDLSTQNPPFVGLFYQNRSPSTRLKYNISPLFRELYGYVYSPEYPILDHVLRNLQQEKLYRPFESQLIDRVTPINNIKARRLLAGQSFKKLIDQKLSYELVDEIIRLKAIELYNELLIHGLKDYVKRSLHDFYLSPGRLDFAQFRKKMIPEKAHLLDSILSDWYHGNRVASLFFSDIRQSQTTIEGERVNRISVKVYNPSPYTGTVEIVFDNKYYYSPDNTLNMGPIYRILPTSSYELNIISPPHSSFSAIYTGISKNIPGYFKQAVIEQRAETTDTTTGLRQIGLNEFCGKESEIIVDNEDPGFSMFTSGQDKLFRRIKSLFSGESSTDTDNLSEYFEISSKWRRFISPFCYGDTLRSAVYKTAGQDNSKAIWIADIPSSGKYEVLVYYNGYDGMSTYSSQKSYSFSTGGNNITLNYTVYDSSGVHEVVITPPPGNNTYWVSLGEFYFDEGEARVELHDKGGMSSEEKKELKDKRKKADRNQIFLESIQLIVADAVKWVKTEE